MQFYCKTKLQLFNKNPIYFRHQLEMQLLEEKHTEELQLYKLQHAQAVQQISQLKNELQKYGSRKSAMVETLHSLLEAHRQETLRVVSGSSPVATHGAEHTRLQVHQTKSAELMTGRLQSQVQHRHF
jgi:4-diphosphocytidyl-2C-methyl-D-erythritol kinase